MKFVGFYIDEKAEEEAMKITGSKSKTILYTKALEFAMKKRNTFVKEFSVSDRTKIKDIKKRSKND